MKLIQLGRKDVFAKVDDVDYESIIKTRWYLTNHGYAVTNVGVRMHRLIINAKPGETVDHIDRDRLNNVRSNLRLVNASQNCLNRSKTTNTRCNYKGAYHIKATGSWSSQLGYAGVFYSLGFYKSELAAAIAYNRKAKELSDYFVLNEIKLSEEEQDEILINDLQQRRRTEKQSLHKGVYWNKHKKLWLARHYKSGKIVYLGEYKDVNEAIRAVENYKSKNNIP